MHNILLPIILLFSLSIYQAKAQATTISVGPLLTCDLTTFSCPGVSGCCTIGGCCGTGCCANGYTCINEGTSDQTCCPASDPTKCGTVTSSSGSGSGSGSDGTCTAIDNCPRDPDTGLAWTCLLGKTCGASYRDCNPCPYIASGSGSSGGSSGSSSSGSDSTSPSTSSSPTSTMSSSGSGSSSLSGSSPSSGSSSSSKSSGCRSREISLKLHWVAAVGFGGALATFI